MPNAFVDLGDRIVDELKAAGFSSPVNTIERRNTWEVQSESDLPPGRRIVVSPAGIDLIADSRDGFRIQLTYSVALAESISSKTLDAREDRIDELNGVLLEIVAHLTDHNHRRLGEFGFVAINGNQAGGTVEPFDVELLRDGVYFARHVFTWAN